MAKDIISLEVRWDSDEGNYEIGLAVNGEWKKSWTLNREFSFESAEDRAEEIVFGDEGINDSYAKYTAELSGFLKSPKFTCPKKVEGEPDKTEYLVNPRSLWFEMNDYYGVHGQINRLNARIQDDIDTEAAHESQALEACKKIISKGTDLVEGATKARRMRIAYNLK